MRYTELRVWQRSMKLVECIYQITTGFPSHERFGLAGQLQRAAVSVPSNIAEGHGRKLTGSYVNHISIAYGSLMEIETQLRISQRLNYIKAEDLKNLLNECDLIGKMLTSLKKSLKNSRRAGYSNLNIKSKLRPDPRSSIPDSIKTSSQSSRTNTNLKAKARTQHA
jgi:four helix bundle protein